MWTAPPITLTDEQRVELKRRVVAHKTPVRAASRARIILLAADGVASRKISATVGMHESNVAKWRNRFRDKGLGGLEDDPRSGRPRRFGHDDRMAMAAAATSERDPDDPVSTWTHVELAERLWFEGVEVSVSQLGRILAAMDIHPDQVRGWLNRRDDPNFWDRVRDVCGLYLDPPERALVLSVDEKTAIQAKERRHPDQAPAPGRPRRREFEYRRHGTASLLAAMDVHWGSVVATPIDRNNSVTFCAFLTTIDEAVEADLAIHVILDNGSSHVSKVTRAWFDAHPRWVVHYTPVHASWVNQIELFFSILQRKVIRNGNFTSREDLVAKLLAFISDYDQTAKPFAWTYSGDPLKVG
ncbi:MAG: IS630 family transposase [Acidimicrobiales bacterium]